MVVEDALCPVRRNVPSVARWGRPRFPRVDLVILTVSGRVEIREAGFNYPVSVPVPVPVPEPGTTALMLLGLVGVAGIASRRKA